MEVQLHAKAKHWGLKAYMDILGRVLKGKRKFVYVDLFCGDGYCTATVGKDTRYPQQSSWDGPPLYAVKNWSTLPNLDFSCVFNDKDPSKIKCLKSSINKLKLDLFVEAYYSEEADIIASKIIETHLKVPSCMSLIFMDPQRHYQLSWKTIELFAQFSEEDVYHGKKFIRRPELIINLMTYTMYRSYTHRPEEITRSLGTSEWKKGLKWCKKRNLPIYIAFYDSFINQLKKFYPEEGIFPFQVHNLKNRGMNYYLIYAVSHPLAIKIFSNDLEKRIEKYKNDDLVGEYTKLSHEAQGKIPLDHFL